MSCGKGKLSQIVLLGSSSTSEIASSLGAQYKSVRAGGVWAKTFGGTQDDVGRGVALDSSGNIYVVGSTSSFGAGGSDVILLKYNSSGTLQWKKTYGGTGLDSAEDCVVDGSSLYVVGFTESYGQGGSDVLILKVDTSDGSLIWDRTYGTRDGDEIGYGVDVDSSGNVYIGGTRSNGNTNDDCIIIKYNSSGILQWDKEFGGRTDTDQIWGIDVGGNYLYIAGYTDSVNGGASAAAKIDISQASPSFSWKKYLGNASAVECGYDVAVDSSGNVYVTGMYSAGTGSLTYKLSSSGVYQSHQVIADSVGLGIDADDTAVYVAGVRRDVTPPHKNVLLVKYNASNGSLGLLADWGDRIAGVHEEGNAIALDGGGYVYIAGVAPDDSADWLGFLPVGALEQTNGDITSWSMNDAWGYVGNPRRKYRHHRRGWHRW